MTEKSLARAIFDQACGLSGAIVSETMQTVWFCNGDRNGYIRLWGDHIVEMEIPVVDFWAHFDGNDAILFYDHVHAFFEVLHEEDGKGSDFFQQIRPMKLLIICSTGITSSIAASHINELAREHDWNVQADWCPVAEAPFRRKLADAVLYAPQAAAAFQELTEQERQNAALIQPKDFATMNMTAILHQAQRLVA